MEKSLQHSTLYGNVSRPSFGGADSRPRPNSGSPFSTTPGRKTMLDSPMPGMPYGTPNSVYKKTHANQSRFSVSGRSNQSIIGIRSEFNAVENYGFQLPVLINEALTFNEKNQNVSVKCAPNGWAWVVHGRRLLIWQYKDGRNSGSGSSPPRLTKEMRTPQRRGGALAQCRELTLPHCDIGHKANLVSVYLGETQQMASCVAVSPTGDVRYWPSIAHDASSVDVTGILDGQEFDNLLEMPDQQGYLMVTTTCSLVYLQLQLLNGRHVLQHRTIRQHSGFLGGIGKKFSMIMGMNSASEKENKFVSIACEGREENDVIVSVLADRWIQRWRLASNGSGEQLLYEDCDIVRRLRDEFQQKFWNIRVESITVELHLLDMKVHEDKTYVLAAGINAAHTPQMYYAIATLTPDPDGMRLETFVPLKLSQFYSAGTAKECLGLRFIIGRTHLYLYTDRIVYPMNLAQPSMAEIDAEKIEFHLQDDRILSAAICGQIPLFFSRLHGLISVTPGDFDSSDFVGVPNTTGGIDLHATATNADGTLRADQLGEGGIDSNLYMFDLDPDALYNDFKDEVNQLKAAFIYRLKRNTNMCNTILNNLLRNTAGGQTPLADGSQLDKIVITIAEDLAEDIPAADPRWEQLWGDLHNNKPALGSSSSLQIVTQLKEKNMALRHFVEFLHSTGIWDKLNAVPSGGGSVLKPTCFVVADINEKIIGAIALRSIQSKYGKIIDEAISLVVSKWQEQPFGSLTAQDLFYVRVCKFQEIVQAFSDMADTRIESQLHSTTLATFIADINKIVLQITTEVLAFREENAAIFTLPADKTDVYECLPWTAMSGSVGLRDAFTHLVDISVRYGARCAVESELKHTLYQQILELIDFILDGRRNYLESVRDTEKYNVLLQQFESQRRDLISILIDDGQHEFATKLAEKYLDFQSLIVICDLTNNQERLDTYIQKYEEYDFSQFAINWHLRENRQGEVFERFKRNQAALSQFLRDHPTLGWLQLIFNGDFERAAKTLFQLAQSETELVERKKLLLSLAKLAAFAASDSDLTMQVDNINSELNIIEYQEHLGEPILTALGYDTENQKVLKVEEIINLFIAEENETISEFEFRKAVELLHFTEDPYEARAKIWCAAILRDNWLDYDSNKAVDYIQTLHFFKLVEVCHLMDGDVDNFLPPMEELLNSPELEGVVHNQAFQYLIKLAYEYIQSSFKKSEEMQED